MGSIQTRSDKISTSGAKRLSCFVPHVLHPGIWTNRHIKKLFRFYDQVNAFLTGNAPFSILKLIFVKLKTPL